MSTTKTLSQKFREDGWGPLFEKVKSFCEKHDVEIPDMSARYTAGRGQSRSQIDHITIEHHFRVDIFMVTIDSQSQELNNRLKEDVMELSALDPRDDYRLFKIEDICRLADKFYPTDFNEQEKLHIFKNQTRSPLTRSQDLGFGVSPTPFPRYTL